MMVNTMPPQPASTPSPVAITPAQPPMMVNTGNRPFPAPAPTPAALPMLANVRINEERPLPAFMPAPAASASALPPMMVNAEKRPLPAPTPTPAALPMLANAQNKERQTLPSAAAASDLPIYMEVKDKDGSVHKPPVVLPTSTPTPAPTASIPVLLADNQQPMFAVPSRPQSPPLPLPMLAHQSVELSRTAPVVSKPLPAPVIQDEEESAGYASTRSSEHRVAATEAPGFAWSKQ
jgi:hypothetical protein